MSFRRIPRMRLGVPAETGTRVLLVDDDDIVLEYLSLVVAGAGYIVDTATSAEAALLAMQHNFSPIVILDIKMPGMDGLALCRAIRGHTYSEYVYLLLHTSQDSETDILAGLDAGADDLIGKGTSKIQLIGRLRIAQRIISLENGLRTMLARSEPIVSDMVPEAAAARPPAADEATLHPES
jgi:sigma-B regulation protein RsbU (phosphoserine phosphatase)